MLSDTTLISSKRLKGAVILAEGGSRPCLFLQGIRASLMIKSACHDRREQLGPKSRGLGRAGHFVSECQGNKPPVNLTPRIQVSGCVLDGVFIDINLPLELSEDPFM